MFRVLLKLRAQDSSRVIIFFPGADNDVMSGAACTNPLMERICSTFYRGWSS